MVKICKNCGDEFKTYKTRQNFCSRNCGIEYNKLERKIIECEYTGCTNTFEVIPTSKRIKRFCSKECQCEWQKYFQLGENNGNYGRDNKWGSHSEDKRKEISEKIKKSWKKPERLEKHLVFLEKHRLEDGSFDFQDIFFRDRISKANIERLLNNPQYGSYSNCKKGWFKSIKTGDDEYYHSSWEEIKMKEMDNDDNIMFWTKKHGFVIEYIHNGVKKRYLPDFLIEKKEKEILEVKGYVDDEEVFKLKCQSALEYFNKIGIDYNIDFMMNENKYKELYNWFKNKKKKIYD